jgi:cytochrome c
MTKDSDSIMTQEMNMKNIWMLTVLLALAGCQPDVQESPATSTAPLPKAEEPLAAAPAAIPPAPQKESAKRVVVVPTVKPVQTKPAPEKSPDKSAAVIAPPVTTTADTAELGRIEKTAAAESVPAATAMSRAQLSEADAMALARKKNCFACHALDKKVVGPAWKAVAEKYRGDAGAQTALESKVRKGGKGNWGAVAMPPQSALSEEELSGLVQFVLQLK